MTATKTSNPFEAIEKKYLTPEEISIHNTPLDAVALKRIVMTYCMERARRADIGAISYDVATKDVRRARLLYVKLMRELDSLNK